MTWPNNSFLDSPNSALEKGKYTHKKCLHDVKIHVTNVSKGKTKCKGIKRNKNNGFYEKGEEIR